MNEGSEYFSIIKDRVKEFQKYHQIGRNYILAHGLCKLQVAILEFDLDRFRIDYSDPFNHLANDLVIIVRKAIEMFLQISCVLCHT